MNIEFKRSCEEYNEYLTKYLNGILNILNEYKNNPFMSEFFNTGKYSMTILNKINAVEKKVEVINNEIENYLLK